MTPTTLTAINSRLNHEQRQAVCVVLNRVSGAGPTLVFGPPGTGKTVTMVECAQQLLIADPTFKYGPAAVFRHRG